MLRSFCLPAMVLLSATLSLGCLPTTPPTVVKPGGHEGHNHAHHGPHGGHVIEIGDEEYHGEWTHDDDGKITVYLLDKDIKKPVAIPAEKVTITVATIKKEGKDPVNYDLVAVNRSEGDKPTASQFEITDKALLGLLEALSPGGIEATLTADINGKLYTSSMAEDPHHHH